MSFLNFLKETRKFVALKPHNFKTLTIVIGNESCDLDSAVCALALAFIHKSNQHEDKAFLPVLNICRRDYPTKTEVCYLFNKLGIVADTHLTFRNELTPELLARSRFILVDHYTSPFGECVDEVYDHRPYDPSCDRLPPHCQRVIEQVGSCATLIAEIYFSSTLNVCNIRSPIVNTLLHRAIVLDTVNFSEKINRATPKDHCMAAKLECDINVTLSKEERTLIFNELVAARADISHLNGLQILRKDMKVIEVATNAVIKIALPGFPMSVADFVHRADALASVRSFAVEIDCPLIVLLGMCVDKATGDVTRDIGLVVVQPAPAIKALSEKIKSALLSAESPAFNLQEINNVNFMEGSFFRQLNVTATRKHILPVINRALNEWAKIQQK